MIMPQQLPLPFSFNPELGFEQFHPGLNAEPVAHLKQTAAGTGEHLVFLWGEAETGKTHLLNACCRAATQRARSVSYLPLELFREYGPDVLDGLEHQDLVCLDDLDRVVGDEAWETGLFVLFNRLREAQRDLVVAARAPAARLDIRLPDLKTRFGWGLTLRLHALRDEDKLAVLELEARALGLELPPQVGRFLLAHYPRDLPALRRLLEQLDHATLAAKRRLTVPFLKTILGETI
jgi:DnaA family protein